MKKIAAAALAMSLAAAMASCSGTQPGVNDNVQAPALQRITPDPANANREITAHGEIDCAADFCKNFQIALASESYGKTNTLTSPLSAYIALSMVREGADENTLSQLTDALGGADSDEIYGLISHLTSLEETTLNTANSIWFDTRFDPKSDFLKKLSDVYLAEGFKTDISSAENEINLWIQEHTNGLIKEMLSENSLDDSVMAIINTVYMKASWMSQFSPYATHEREFKNADGSIAAAEFMYKKAFHKVIENERYIGVSLPYSDGSLEFVAVMPRDAARTSADAVLDVMVDGGWGNVIGEACEEKIKLYFPKFEQKMNGSLVDTLKKMGITDAFSPDAACFSGIAENIYIQDVIQNAILKLDEGGTEAAAATIIDVAPTSMLMPEDEPRTIDFNRPFAFAVVDRATGTVIFCGERNTAE